MKTIIKAAMRATVTIAAGLLVAMAVLILGRDSYEVWYRAYSHSTLLIAIAIISGVTGAAAMIGFRAAAPLLQQTRPTGTLSGVAAGLAVTFFLVVTGREYTGGFWLPLTGLVVTVGATSFYLARLDRKAAEHVV